ncbi:MAG: cytochrome C oxidase Cbb3 [Candidatus Rokuibacteriota bacterium]|nr:MAG: cytochrome C oxidase Cbb3 [Candidatus Rokubacteria bacterium]
MKFSWRFGAIFAVLLLAAHAGRGQERQPASPDTGSSNTVDGEKLFATSCGWCHQDGGRAAGRGPKLAGSDRTDEYLLNRIRVGKEGAMPAFAGSFSEPQLRAIVAYIRSLKDTHP